MQELRFLNLNKIMNVSNSNQLLIVPTQQNQGH